MIGIDSRAARSTWTAVLILLLLIVVYLIRQTIFVFILAILFAYMLWPLVRILDRRLPGRSKTPALAIVYVLLVGVLILLGFAIGSSVVSEANALAGEVPEIISKVSQPVTTAGSAAELKTKILMYVRDQVVAHSQQIVTALSRGAVEILSRAEGLLFVVLVPILSFFCLKDGARLLQEFLERINDHSRRREHTIFFRISICCSRNTFARWCCWRLRHSCLTRPFWPRFARRIQFFWVRSRLRWNLFRW